jgi:hypothetical protein
MQGSISDIYAGMADLHGAVSHGFMRIETKMRGLGTRLTSLEAHQA